MQYVAFFTQNNSSLSRFVPNFRILSKVIAEKSLTEKLAICISLKWQEKIENLKKEGKMRISTLTFIYTIHCAYLNVDIKFENTGSNRS